jgi:hypothetical protein
VTSKSTTSSELPRDGNDPADSSHRVSGTLGGPTIVCGRLARPCQDRLRRQIRRLKCRHKINRGWAVVRAVTCASMGSEIHVPAEPGTGAPS